MRTTINAKPAPWTPEIETLWESFAEERPEGIVSSTNYFTPRPHVDEYNRASPYHGFVYIVGREVFMKRWDKEASCSSAQ